MASGIEFGCCVTDLARATTDERLAQAFSHFGEIIKVKVDRVSTTGISKGTGLVIFKQLRSAIEAMNELNRKELDGQNITVELMFRILGPTPYDYGTGYDTRPMEVYGCILDNLSPCTSDESLAHAFARFRGIIELKVSRDSETGRSDRCGYVTFKEHSSARIVVDEMNGEEIDGHNITAKLVTQILRADGYTSTSISSPLPFSNAAGTSGYGGAAPFGYGGGPAPATPYVFGYGAFCSDGYGVLSMLNDEVGYGCVVGNMAVTTTNESLGYHFSRFGVIIQLLVSKDSVTGKFKGLVVFKERASVRAAIDAMDGVEIDGEKIVVKVAHASGPIGYGVDRCECGLAIACRQVGNDTTRSEGGDVARERGSLVDVACGSSRTLRKRKQRWSRQ